MGHTPGPWDIRRMPDWNNKGGQHFAAYCFFNMPPIRDEDEANANARLIAAAPDLLEACKRACWTFENLSDAEEMTEGDAENYRDLLAAIAKAEGREA